MSRRAAAKKYYAGREIGQLKARVVILEDQLARAQEALLERNRSLRGMEKGLNELRRALRYMDHVDDCTMTEWRDSCDHFLTSFGARILGPTCTCGMIKTALQIERTHYGNAAIPHQHRKELCA